jgi:hypothetical protein
MSYKRDVNRLTEEHAGVRKDWLAKEKKARLWDYGEIRRQDIIKWRREAKHHLHPSPFSVHSTPASGFPTQADSKPNVS